MPDNATGYDPLSGLNSGNLDFQSLQGNLGGYLYNAPVAFNPDAIPGVNSQTGYIDFGANYNPNPGAPGNNDYLYYGNYGEALAASNPTHGAVSYGSAAENSLVGTPGNGDPMINGVDYTSGASYASLAAQGIGTYNPGGIGTPENGAASSYITPYNQYTEPGYTAPTATATGPTGSQSYGPDGSALSGGYNPTSFLYGNNGSAGSLSGTFTNTTPGQSSQFYQSEPGSLTNGTPSTLGTLQPYNPALQALNTSRSQ